MEEDVPLSEIKTILKQLIAIPSVNPDHVQDAEIKQTICGEARMAEKLRESFTSFGAESPLGCPVFASTLVTGGTALNIIPETATLKVCYRALPGQTSHGLHTELDTVVQAQAAAHPECVNKAEVNVFSFHEGFSQDPAHPFVSRLCSWAGKPHTLAPFCTNAGSYSTDLVRAMVVMGPGSIEQAHRADEFVALSELALMARVMRHWLFEEH
eukprot:RCo014438